MRTALINLLIVLFVMCSCDKSNDSSTGDASPITSETNSVSISTDKACYIPNEEVVFSVDGKLPSGVMIRYRHLDELIQETSYSVNTWRWRVPNRDFNGYLMDVYHLVDGKEVVLGSIAIDVSSQWTRFPRYGFLSSFDSGISSSSISSNMDLLNRYHINALQYYDWHNKHHMPLKMEDGTPAHTWYDIARREVSFHTVEKYIQEARKKNIASMSYNLLYGAWEGCQNDGVDPQWMLYDDQNHQRINKHDLDDNWAFSDILVANPENDQWQNYIFEQTEKIYENLDFDGWHLDQLGDRGKVYDYQGNIVDLKKGYHSFLQRLRERFPHKKMVLNAVNQYGQAQILNTDVDFAYSEVWSPNERYEDLAQIIMDNNTLCGDARNTVLAAYMNYDRANSSGYFNTPAVLLTDAVIFAFGGAHLELGEHMLGKEYFPNNNLLMKKDLKHSLIQYYDFMVAYENILRGGGSFNTPQVVSSWGQVPINSWPPQLNGVTVVGKDMGHCQVIHLLNFINLSSLHWRDNAGTQPYPQPMDKLKLDFMAQGAVSKIWFASPDKNYGTACPLEFSQEGSKVSLQVPSLKYWDMIVVEY